MGGHVCNIDNVRQVNKLETRRLSVKYQKFPKCCWSCEGDHVQVALGWKFICPKIGTSFVP